MSARVVLVGGAGVFGARLAEGLRATTDATIIVAGRSSERAQTAARALGVAEAAILDRRNPKVAALRALAPDIVIDAAGPFQGADLSFARAALEAGAHYLDLADARDFVAAFPVLDALAKAQGRSAITGVSSTPALTHAALDALCAGWRRVDSVLAGIAPGNRAPRGRALVESILSRAGTPLRVFADGGWRERRGWSHCKNIVIGGLGMRRFALVDTPDLDLIPARFSPTDTALFMAALELAPLQRGLETVSCLRGMGLWREPERAGALLKAFADLLKPLGSDHGAMIVEAQGRDSDDRPCHARWTLLAHEGRGPYAPTLPALALVRRLIAGDGPPPGARACVGLLSLDDLAEDFARLRMETRIERGFLFSPFEQALGPDFARAPAPVVRAHRAGPVARFEGQARVMGGATLLARSVARLVGFPATAQSAPVQVTMRLGAGGEETWRRRIGDSRFESRLRCVRPGVCRETFGPLSFDMAMEVEPGRLRMRVTAWRLGPIPLPAFLAPRSFAVESADAQGRFHFDVPIAAPLIGRIAHYSGWLAPAAIEQSLTPADTVNA